jgi:hypothetical protein
MDPQEKQTRRMIAAALFEQGELRDSQIAACWKSPPRR